MSRSSHFGLELAVVNTRSDCDAIVVGDIAAVAIRVALGVAQLTGEHHLLTDKAARLHALVWRRCVMTGSSTVVCHAEHLQLAKGGLRGERAVDAATGSRVQFAQVGRRLVSDADN